MESQRHPGGHSGDEGEVVCYAIVVVGVDVGIAVIFKEQHPRMDRLEECRQPKH